MLPHRSCPQVADDSRCSYLQCVALVYGLSPHYSAVFYIVVMLLYIFLELPAIQLFAVHRKRSEANFIRRYHLVMFVLTLFCVTFQVLVHSVHRYGNMLATAPPKQQSSSNNEKRQRSTERLLERQVTITTTPPTTAPATASASGSATAAAAATTTTSTAAPTSASSPAVQQRHVALLSPAHRGVSSPLLKRSGS